MGGAKSAEGYRLIWLHSTSKAEHDADARYKQVARTTVRLSDLRQKLASPRTRSPWSGINCSPEDRERHAARR